MDPISTSPAFDWINVNVNERWCNLAKKHGPGLYYGYRMSKTKIGYITVGCVAVFYNKGQLIANLFCSRYKMNIPTGLIGEKDKKSYTLHQVLLFFLSHINKNINKPFCVFDFRPLSFLDNSSETGLYIE